MTLMISTERTAMDATEHEPPDELSAVGRLLWERGVGRPGGMSVREAERQTGVSRTTLHSWMRPVDPASPIRHSNENLQAVADGLGIDRRRLGIASFVDNGARESTVDDDDTFLRRLEDIQRKARELDEVVTAAIADYAERRHVVTR